MKLNKARLWLVVMLTLGLFHATGIKAQDPWTLRPEMSLPPIPAQTVSVIKTNVHFDFESGLDGWLPRHPDVKIERSRASSKAGKGALYIQGRDPSNWNFIISPEIPVEPGKHYRASLWTRMESSPAGSRPVYFKIEFVDDDHKTGSRVSSSSVPPGRLHEWVQLEVEFQAPPNCHRVWAALEKGTESPASIDVTLDDFVLEEIAGLSEEADLTQGALIGPITTTLAHVHPRIYLTAKSLANLRAQIHSDPRWARARFALVQIADQGLRSGPPNSDLEPKIAQKAGKAGLNEQLWQRPVGNMIPHLALAYLLSGDRRYLEGAQQWIFASLSYPTWGLGEADGMDLATGHQLAGIGLAYDWLYNDLTVEERSLIRQGVLKRAGAMARAARARRVWWEHSYLQNHLWVNSAGLATAGFAMCDEIDEARGWIRLAHEKFLTSLSLLGDDGASHEGYGYWEYGVEYILRYTEMAHDLLGIDLYQSGKINHPGLSKAPLYALYLALPCRTWSRSQSIIDIGDCPRTHWYGPSYSLRNLARRYPDTPEAGIAQWFAEQTESTGVDMTASGHYLNLVWSNPALPQVSPQNLPTLHHFTDLDIVSARSDWTGTGSLLVVKCGPPLGHRQLHAPYDYGVGHVHPDAGHFIFFSGGQFLLRDDGYSPLKRTSDHSTLLIDGQGQKGEGQTWFDYSPWLLDQRAPRIVSATSTRDVDVIICDAAAAYPPDSGLKRFIRTFRFQKPSQLEVSDDLAADRPVIFETRLQVEGAVEKISPGVFRLTQKNVTALIRIDESARVVIDLRKNSTGTALCLVSQEKRSQAHFKVTLTTNPF